MGPQGSMEDEDLKEILELQRFWRQWPLNSVLKDEQLLLGEEAEGHVRKKKEPVHKTGNVREEFWTVPHDWIKVRGNMVASEAREIGR